MACVQSIMVMAMSAAELCKMHVRMVPKNRNNRMVAKLLGSKLAKKACRAPISSGGTCDSPRVVRAKNIKDIPKRKSPM